MSKPHLIGPTAMARPAAQASDGFVSNGLGGPRKWAAGSYDDPALVGWYPRAGSADTDLLGEIDTITPRTRDLDRNAGLTFGARLSFQDSIIGHQLRVNPAPDREELGWSSEQAETWSRNVRSKFASWFDRAGEVDAARMLAGRALVVQALGAWFMNGDSFMLPRWRPIGGTRWNTRLQAVESDRVDTPPFLSYRKNIRRGIEYDTAGAVRAMWVRKTHPGDYCLDTAEATIPEFQWNRIPAYTPWGRRRIIMLFDKERPGQSRGVGMVTRIIRELRMAQHYTRTELQAAIASSLVAGILKSALDPETAQSLFKSGEDRDDYWRNAFADYAPTLKSAAILQLPLGADFEGFAPNRPNQAFDAFMQSVLHNIAAGMGISYEVLTKDFSRTNYSSARASLLEVWRFFMSKRAWLQEMLLQPIYELWLEEAVNAGVVEAPDFYDHFHAYTKLADWTMAGRGWIDPMKEAQAAVLRRRARITSLKEECETQGLDWREVAEQSAIEERYFEELKIAPMLPEAQTVSTDNLDDPNAPDDENPSLTGEEPEQGDEGNEDERQAA